MPKSESGIPEGYTGKAISVMACPVHGAHVNLDVLMTPREAWETATTLAAASSDPESQLGGTVPVMVDQLSPEACETFARDLLEAAEQCRQQIAAHIAGQN